MVDMEKIEAELDEIVEECRECDYVRFSVVVEHCTNIRELLSELEWHPKIVVAGEERSGMADRELLLERLERLAIVLDELMPQCAELVREAFALLKEQELPTELKQKMWNALYAEEDEYEKKFVGKEEHLNWFTVYRPWLQKGFDIAIDAIAEWEGR